MDGGGTQDPPGLWENRISIQGVTPMNHHRLSEGHVSSSSNSAIAKAISQAAIPGPRMLLSPA